MTTTVTPTPTHTQDDLDADIAGITDDLTSAVEKAARIKGYWHEVQHLHPGVTAVEYIRDRVPFLNRNMSVAVALVEAGVAGVTDAARLTGHTPGPVSRAAAKVRASLPQGNDAKPKPTTIATGKATPGPRIGTSRVAKHPTPNPEYSPPVAAVEPIHYLMEPDVLAKVVGAYYENFCMQVRGHFPSQDVAFDAALEAFLVSTEARLKKVK